jgi:hypothetical protein
LRLRAWPALSAACATLLAACYPPERTPDIVHRDCLPADDLLPTPNSEILPDQGIIEAAAANRRSRHGEQVVENAECCMLIWMDTRVDETRGEWLSLSRHTHRQAREAGLQRYAVVMLNVRDSTGAEQLRQTWFDQCGNPLR